MGRSIGRPAGEGRHLVRYTNPITGVVSPTSQYINEQGIKKVITTKDVEYKVDGEWLKSHLVPHKREMMKKNLNTKKGFMLNTLEI